MDEINRRWQLVRMDAGPFIVFACGFLMGVVAMAALLRGIGLS